MQRSIVCFLHRVEGGTEIWSNVWRRTERTRDARMTSGSGRANVFQRRLLHRHDAFRDIVTDKESRSRLNEPMPRRQGFGFWHVPQCGLVYCFCPYFQGTSLCWTMPSARNTSPTHVMRASLLLSTPTLMYAQVRLRGTTPTYLTHSKARHARPNTHKAYIHVRSSQNPHGYETPSEDRNDLKKQIHGEFMPSCLSFQTLTLPPLFLGSTSTKLSVLSMLARSS